MLFFAEWRLAGIQIEYSVTAVDPGPMKQSTLMAGYFLCCWTKNETRMDQWSRLLEYLIRCSQHTARHSGILQQEILLHFSLQRVWTWWSNMDMPGSSTNNDTNSKNNHKQQEQQRQEVNSSNSHQKQQQSAAAAATSRSSQASNKQQRQQQQHQQQ